MWYHVQQAVEKLCRTLHDEPLCRTLCRTLFFYVFLTWYGSHTQRIMVYVKIMWYHGQNSISGGLPNLIISSYGHLVNMVILSSCPLTIWSSFQYCVLVIWLMWSSGHLDNWYSSWSSGHQVFWSSAPLVIGSFGHLVIWSAGYKVIWPSGHLIILSI